MSGRTRRETDAGPATPGAQASPARTARPRPAAAGRREGVR